LTGSEGFAGIDDVDGLRVCDFIGVPEIGGINLAELGSD
jgi:hypothetical protein